MQLLFLFYIMAHKITNQMKNPYSGCMAFHSQTEQKVTEHFSLRSRDRYSRGFGLHKAKCLLMYTRGRNCSVMFYAIDIMQRPVCSLMKEFFLFFCFEFYYFIQQILISYPFYTYECIYVNPNLPVHPTTTPPSSVLLHHMLCLIPTNCLK